MVTDTSLDQAQAMGRRAGRAHLQAVEGWIDAAFHSLAPGPDPVMPEPAMPECPFSEGPARRAWEDAFEAAYQAPPARSSV